MEENIRTNSCRYYLPLEDKDINDNRSAELGIHILYIDKRLTIRYNVREYVDKNKMNTVFITLKEAQDYYDSL